ncbi:MAG: hypothetical protein Q9220_006095 [cf. Caloplaca sp. 1 TL-2023]
MAAGLPDDRSVNEVQRLDDTIQKLKKSIKYWQTWDVEYEALREELQSLARNVNFSSLQQISSRCTGDLLDQKEISLLLQDDKRQPRTSQQIIGLLSRRIEYVQSNVKSLEKSVQAAEGSLVTLWGQGQTQQDSSEAFPLMDIQEELDEDGNVISSSMTPASDAAPQVLEALRKAGLKDLPSPQNNEVPRDSPQLNKEDDKSSAKAETAVPILKKAEQSLPRPPRKKQPSPSTSESDTTGDDGKAGRRRKSVTFADGTKQASPMPPEPRPARDVQAAKARSRAKRIKAEVRGSVDALKKVHEAGYINDEVFDRFREQYIERLQGLPPIISAQPNGRSKILSGHQPIPSPAASTTEDFNPVIPTNETARDAALRQEMIRYNMNEVGTVVAEMNLDDTDSLDSEISSEETHSRNSSDDEENRWGLNIKPTLSNNYVKEMQALDQKLNAKSIQNVGPKSTMEEMLQAEDELVVGEDGSPANGDSSVSSANHGKKAVKFAKALDIQEQPSSHRKDNAQQIRETAVNSVKADVIERQVATNGLYSTATPMTKKKASRFRSSLSPKAHAVPATNNPPSLPLPASNRGPTKTPSLPAFTPPATPKMMPTGPPGRTHAPRVVERPYSDSMKTENASEPDEFDASLMQQELKMDYHRTRNRMIQRQGGFLPEDDEADEDDRPLLDENGKKISRFKAARLKGLS